MADSLAIRPKKTLSNALVRCSADDLATKLTSIIDSEDLRADVREFCFSAQTRNDPSQINYLYRSHALYEQVLRTLRCVSLLHNLKVLRCTLPLGSYEYLLDHDPEDKFDKNRGEIVKTLVIGSTDGPVERHHTPRELATLDIVNLPCQPQPDLTGHPSFSALLRTLQTLVLRFDYPSTDKSPYRFAPLGDVAHEFFTDLPKTWLAPASTGLTSLTLGANELWGYLLKVDFHDVRFPHLNSLDMQRFVFSHDWQLAWLLSHKSLHTLSLHQCRMLTEARWYGKKDGKHYPTEYSPDGYRFSPQEYQYAKSWHHYYEELSAGLENLTSFTTIFDEGSTTMNPDDGQYVELHWLGWYPVTPHHRTLAEDEKELNLLQAKISSRSGH